MKQIFNEMDYEDVTEMEDNFNCLFDNEYDNKGYVVHGTLGLWDGKYKVYSNEVHPSLKEAIWALGDGYKVVYEEKYGHLMVESHHHDGVDIFEIREITPMGEELLNNNYDGNLSERKGATRNVWFYKNEYGGTC